jgi:diguanylate cyclase (GGDEF)-like protein
LLDEVGIRCVDGHASETLLGFPLSIALRDGQQLCLDLNTPGPFAKLDADEVGFAVVDSLGYPRRTWGLAARVPHLKGDRTLIESPLKALLERTVDGRSESTFLDGFRFYSAPVPVLGGAEVATINDVLILVVNAQDEARARKRAIQSERFAQALKRVGKVLTMNQGIAGICQAAAHEIASATELAAALVWVTEPEGHLALKASIGVTRPGVQEVESLDYDQGPNCVAELVASTARKFSQRSVFGHVMTAGLEANICYLKPGGVFAYPLMAGGRPLGVVEMIGRAEDPDFEDQAELFETFAEHLSLAINAASMFETAERSASHDALTGIANHRTMQEFLHKRVAEAQRTGTPVSVLMLDVDHFRSYNEEEGHDAGDRVLRQVSQRINEAIRPRDLAARYGGEEFTVVLVGTDLADAIRVGERIRQAIDETPFESVGRRLRHVTISIGAAAFPETTTDVTALLKAADLALFEAKRSGRNRVMGFSGPLLHEVRERPTPAALERWIIPEVAAETARFVEWAREEIGQYSRSLQLSDGQVAILGSLIEVLPSYRYAIESQELERVRAMAASPEFRLMLPALEAFEERFDGNGPKGLKGHQVPLLARVLQVLHARFRGASLLGDPGRFDAEVLAVPVGRPEAA